MSADQLCRRLQRRRLIRLSRFAWFGFTISPCQGHVLVDRVVHRKVALGDGVGAVGLVLLDERMHLRPKNMFRVFGDVQLVSFWTDEARTTGSAAANEYTREQLKGRYDGHREAPAAHCLTAQPRPEEARETGINERDDAADAGQTFDACETSASEPSTGPCCFSTSNFSFCRSPSGTSTPSGSGPGTTTRDDPVEDNDASQDTAHRRVRCVGRTAANHRHGDWWRHGG